MRRNVTVAVVQLFVVVSISASADVANAQTVKVACVGDSITALPSSWCGNLSTKLGAGYMVSNFGVSGTNLAKGVSQPYWNSAQYTPSHTFAPNIVIIMLGTNDAFSFSWSSAKSHFVADYKELLGTYTSLASMPKPYIIIPTPIGTSPFGHDGDLLATEVVPLVEQVAMEEMVPTIDAFTLFGGAMFDTSLYSASDQVHPNAKGQQLIADEVYKVLMSTGALGGNAGTGGSAGSAGGGGNAGGGGIAGGNAGGGGNTGGAGGGGGSATAGGGGMAGGVANAGAGAMAGSSANTGGSAGLAGAGGGANAGSTGTNVNPFTAAGMGAPLVPAPESSGGGCRTAGNSTSKSGAVAVLLVLFAIAIRSRKRSVSIVQLFVVVHVFTFAGVANAQQIKVACVGDSITAFPTGWCGHLGTKLGSGYMAKSFGVSGTTLLTNVGQPAFSSSAQYQPSHDFAPNIVVIMLGTNDSAPRNWNAGKDHFVADYEELIDSYTSLATHPMVFLNTPPPASDDNMFTISGTTIENEINPLIEQVAMTKMCPLVDVWAAFDGDVENIGSFDGVHPGDAGQMTIAETVYQAIQSPNVPGGNAGTGGSAGSAGSAGAGAGGAGSGGAGGSANTSGAGGGGGSVSAGGGGMAGGSTNSGGSGNAGSSANTAGSTSLAGAGGGSATAGTIPAAGTSAPPVYAPESSGGGCRMAGSSTSKSGAATVLLVLLGIAMRSRKRNDRGIR